MSVNVTLSGSGDGLDTEYSTYEIKVQKDIRFEDLRNLIFTKFQKNSENFNLRLISKSTDLRDCLNNERQITEKGWEIIKDLSTGSSRISCLFSRIIPSQDTTPSKITLNFSGINTSFSAPPFPLKVSKNIKLEELKKAVLEKINKDSKNFKLNLFIGTEDLKTYLNDEEQITEKGWKKIKNSNGVDCRLNYQLINKNPILLIFENLNERDLFHCNYKITIKELKKHVFEKFQKNPEIFDVKISSDNKNIENFANEKGEFTIDKIKELSKNVLKCNFTLKHSNVTLNLKTYSKADKTLHVLKNSTLEDLKNEIFKIFKKNSENFELRLIYAGEIIIDTLENKKYESKKMPWNKFLLSLKNDKSFFCTFIEKRKHSQIISLFYSFYKNIKTLFYNLYKEAKKLFSKLFS
jgi:hypothetical protein